MSQPTPELSETPDQQTPADGAAGSDGTQPGLEADAAIAESILATAARRELDIDALPSYGRSLLRISVPVKVLLAEKKQSVKQIVELGVGSIIKFEKSCDQMLDLEVGGCPIAQGEAVKVGDKFGLRITSITLPDERFQPAAPAHLRG